MSNIKIKTCGNCQYFTGVQCHGHGEYWGNCCKTKKARNDYYFMCYEDTPCLQDKQNLIKLYYLQAEKITQLENEKIINDSYKGRYEISQRRLEKYKKWYNLARKYIPKENYNKFLKEWKKLQ